MYKQKHILAFILLQLFFHSTLLAQETVKGYIINSSNDEVIPNAQVYINSTTIKTSSNEQGYFEIPVTYFPCELIISHTKRKTIQVKIAKPSKNPINIKLASKEFIVRGTYIVNKKERETNLDIVKSELLGLNYLEEKAYIENENKIDFIAAYKDVNVTLNSPEKRKDWLGKLGIWSQDSTHFTHKVPYKLFISSSEPLAIINPSTGYKISLDLQEYVYTENSNSGMFESSFKSYYHFEEQNNNDQIQQNRKLAYYNSSQHFFTSLYNKELKTQGYLITKNVDGIELEYNLYQHLNTRQDYANLKRLKKTEFTVHYFSKPDGSPINLEQKDANALLPISSILTFSTNSCIVNEKGIVIKGGASFVPAVGIKKVTKMLPTNY